MAITAIGAIAPVVGKAGSCVWDPLKQTYRYIEHYSTNVKEVKDKASTLESRLSDITQSRKQGREKGEKVYKGAREWIDKVNNLLSDEELKKLRDQSESSGRGITRCCGYNNNLCSQYKWSKIAEKKRKEIEDRLRDAPHPDQVTRPQSVEEAQQKIADYMFPKKNFKNVGEEIVQKLLYDDDVHVVGLYGNALTGKSKLAKDIMKDERVRNVYGKRVALIEVSETPSTKDIQDKLMQVIAKKWKDDVDEDIQLRAFVLKRALEVHPRRKILIILDHMFWKLNVKALGIYPSKNCKILVISRDKNVCLEMGASKDNIQEMKPLELDEARRLFWTHVFQDTDTMANQVTSWNYVTLGDRLVNEYGRRLPLVVTALAKAVKDQNLDRWESYAKELADKRDKDFRSIWETNIQSLDKSKEKKMFFLLACLSPHESSIPIEELMRYAMGLDKIQWVNNLSEAITQANTWARELISSSLLEADENSKVTIHHLVREHAISLLPTESENYLVKAIPGWHTDETCKEYTAISLMSGSEHSRLDGLDLHNLKILLLNHSQPPAQFSDGFFKGMLNLKILVLKEMTMKPKVPSSINQLLKRSLRLLSLEDCDLGTFADIAEDKVNLVVLSFRGSTMKELPVELVRKCHVLRLLDVSKCKISKRGIPADVLKKLSHLEGLYATDSFDNWAFENHHELDSAKEIFVSDSSECYASVSELNYLNKLNVLKMNLQQLQQLPIKAENIAERLKQFHICVGPCDQAKSAEKSSYRRILQLQSIDAVSITSYSWLKELLKKCEMLKVQRLEKLQQLIRDDDDDDDDDDTFKFPNLQDLQVSECSQMQCFSSKPFEASFLDTLTVDSCESLKYLFKEPDDHIVYPALTLMRLRNLQSLKTVLAESNHSTTSDDIQGQEHQDQAFFHKKISFPLLKRLIMEDLGQIVKLWDVKCKDCDNKDSFRNLKYIWIKNCSKLEGLASLSIVDTLEKLKELTITDCPNIREVMSKEDAEDEKVLFHRKEMKMSTDEDIENENGLILKQEEDDEEEVYQAFPSLKKISLENCSNLQVFLSGNQSLAVEWQRLQTLEIKNCPKLKSLSSGSLKAPDLRQLKIDDDDQTIEDKKNINSILRKYLQDLPESSEGKQGLKKDRCWNVPCIRSACFGASEA